MNGMIVIWKDFGHWFFLRLHVKTQMELLTVDNIPTSIKRDSKEQLKLSYHEKEKYF